VGEALGAAEGEGAQGRAVRPQHRTLGNGTTAKGGAQRLGERAKRSSPGRGTARPRRTFSPAPRASMDFVP
jgi:hypothetical protein